MISPRTILTGLLLMGAISANAPRAQERVATPANANPAGAAESHINRKIGEITGASCTPTLVREGRKVKISGYPFSLMENDDLSCDGSGNLKLKMVDKTDIELYPNSQLHVDETMLRSPDAGTFVMNLLGGSFRFVSEAYHGEGDRYAFHTHTAVLGVRGTVFTAEATKKSTKVFVEQGEVRVTGLANKEVKFVKGGQKVEVTTSGFAK